MTPRPAFLLWFEETDMAGNSGFESEASDAVLCGLYPVVIEEYADSRYGRLSGVRVRKSHFGGDDSFTRFFKGEN